MKFSNLSRLVLLGSLVISSAGICRLEAGDDEPVAQLGDRRQLMADRTIVAVLKNAMLRLGNPVPRETAIAADQPWEGFAIEVSAMFYEDGMYRMLYSDVDPDSGTEDHGFECLALSKDGVVWGKPSLGLVDFRGSKQNNIVADPSGHFIAPNYVFYDPRPSTPSDERVKAIVMREGDRRPGGEGKGLRATIWASSDGREFHPLPISARLQSDWINAFDGGSVFWSEAEQAFVGYFRWWDLTPAPHPRLLKDWMIDRPGVRSVFRTLSRDLSSWSDPQPMGFGNTPREHIYESCISPYFRAPGLYIALANRFNPGRRALTLEEERRLDIAKLPGNKTTPIYTFASDANDIVLMVTKPGSSTFDRPFMEAFLRPGPNLGNWSSRNNYASYSGNCISTGPDEISFYVNRQHLQKANRIQRISLRTDGFVSVNASTLR